MTAALVFHDLAFVNGCVVDHRNAGNSVKLIAEVAEESDHVITGSRPLPKCAALL
jgi:ribosomal protein S10